jgi:hypothetical protein
MGMIALLFGLAVAFFGYRLFLILLPIWAFFFGFFLGAQTLQMIFSGGFLVTITSWVVGFIVGAILAILSYLFYIVAVAIISGSFGYGVTVGILEAIGLDFGFLLWLIAIIVGVIVALVVLRFNIQKYAIILITAVGGTAIIIYTLLALFSGLPPAEILLSPVSTAIQNSFLWFLFFILFVVAGVLVQIGANQQYEIETYNRLAAET